MLQTKDGTVLITNVWLLSSARYAGAHVAIAIVDLEKAPACIRSPDALKSWVYKELAKKGLPMFKNPIRPAVSVETWHDSIVNYKYFFLWGTTS